MRGGRAKNQNAERRMATHVKAYSMGLEDFDIFGGCRGDVGWAVGVRNW